MNWHHFCVEFEFEKDVWWENCMKLLKEVVDATGVTLHFHQFNPDTPMFFAFYGDFEEVKAKIEAIELPKFFTKSYFQENTHDEGNGQHQLSFMCASSAYAIWKATSGEYKSGYENVDESKIVHLLFNALGYETEAEMAYYFRCAIIRGAQFVDFTNTNERDWPRYHIKVKNKMTTEFEKIDAKS